MNPFKDFKIEKHIGEGVFVLAISSLLLFAELSTSAFAQVQYWQIKAGDDVIAVTKTEEDAGEAISTAEHHYDEEGSTNVTVDAEPSLSVEEKRYNMFAAPKVSSANDAAGDIIETAEEDDSKIKITTVQTVTGTRKVDFKTVKQESDELIEDAVAVKNAGKKGEEEVTKKIVMVNGEEISSQELASEVTKAPKNEIVLLGTKVDDEEDAKGNEGSAGRAFNVKQNDDGVTYGGDLPSKKLGKKVAEYGLQFVGNPYVWGGESLTNGADCSGFTLAVYKHFGISLPHDAHAQRNYGIEVSSLKDARPGDLICYHGHIGIYIGNNQIVHAMNEQNGMTVSTIGYNHKPIVTIRRLFA